MRSVRAHVYTCTHVSACKDTIFFSNKPNFFAKNVKKVHFSTKNVNYLQKKQYLCSVKAQIMAIVNVTPDSFYSASRLLKTTSGEVDVRPVVEWARQALSEGADILDIGACSTRPNSTPVEQEEEWRRLEPALGVLRQTFPDVRLSLDTFRPEIAHRALTQFGQMIINDVSGGCEEMIEVVRQANAPYVWTLRGDYQLPAVRQNMQDLDLILDPGFGFIGSTERDYEAMRRLDDLRPFNRPILVGVSRKSMVYKPLGLTPETCLTATQALQMYALEHGATIVRTHDVSATAQTIALWEQLKIK